MIYKVASLKERYDLLEPHLNVNAEVWPEFLLHDPVSGSYWMQMMETFKEYQLLLMDEEEILVAVNSVPIYFDKMMEDLPEDGVEWALQKSLSDHQSGLKPNMLLGLQVMIRKKHQGKGLSALVLKEMSNLGRKKGLDQMVIPVRPNQKEFYPLIPMKNYIQWKDEKGLPFDNWLRVHVRAGGKIIKPCERSGTIPGTIQEWKQWTHLDFPGSGNYVIPGALSPVSIDLENNKGIYVEPNVWVQHPLQGV